MSYSQRTTTIAFIFFTPSIVCAGRTLCLVAPAPLQDLFRRSWRVSQLGNGTNQYSNRPTRYRIRQLNINFVYFPFPHLLYPTTTWTHGQSDFKLKGKLMNKLIPYSKKWNKIAKFKILEKYLTFLILFRMVFALVQIKSALDFIYEEFPLPTWFCSEDKLLRLSEKSCIFLLYSLAKLCTDK